MIPLLFLPAIALMALAIWLAVRYPEPLRAHWLIAFLCSLALQFMLLGARYGYSLDHILAIQHLTGVLIPPLAYLAFKNPPFSARVAVHILPLVIMWLVAHFATYLVDTVLALITFGYAAALPATGLNGNASLSWAPLRHGQLLQVGLWATVVTLVLSGITDSIVAVDFLTTGGAHTKSIASYQGALIKTHGDRPYGPSGRRSGVGDAGHRQAVSTPSDGLYGRPGRRLPKAFGQRRARLPMPRIATPRAPCRKPWEAVSMSLYQRSLVSGASLAGIALLALGVVYFLRSGRRKQLADSSAEDQALVERLSAELDRNQLFRDPDLTLGRLARRLSVPARQISQAVNRSAGLNVSQFVNNRRIGEACNTLATSEISVTNAMLEAGFLTKSNFNREFRRVMGQSPSAWRKAERRKNELSPRN